MIKARTEKINNEYSWYINWQTLKCEEHDPHTVGFRAARDPREGTYVGALRGVLYCNGEVVRDALPCVDDQKYSYFIPNDKDPKVAHAQYLQFVSYMKGEWSLDLVSVSLFDKYSRTMASSLHEVLHRPSGPTDEEINDIKEEVKQNYMKKIAEMQSVLNHL